MHDTHSITLESQRPRRSTARRSRAWRGKGWLLAILVSAIGWAIFVDAIRTMFWGR